jgi:hypothetical protein
MKKKNHVSHICRRNVAKNMAVIVTVIVIFVAGKGPQVAVVFLEKLAVKAFRDLATSRQFTSRRR